MGDQNSVARDVAQKVKISVNEFFVYTKGYEGFWENVQQNRWEPYTFEIFNNYITKDTVYIDVGAWIGVTTLYAAKKAAKCIAIEPDPIAFSQLRANMGLNKKELEKVELVNKALWVGDKEGYVSMRPQRAAGDSMSSIVYQRSLYHRSVGGHVEDFQCQTMTISQLKDKTTRLNAKNLFFKVDIEGAEYTVIPPLLMSMSSGKNITFLSLHPQLLYGEKKFTIIRRFLQAYANSRLCVRMKKEGLLKTEKGGRYSVMLNFLAWILLGRMQKDLILEVRKC